MMDEVIYHCDPITFIVIKGYITSSIIYKSLKDGNAMAIKIKAGLIVQINSVNVPWFKYL